RGVPAYTCARGPALVPRPREIAARAPTVPPQSLDRLLSLSKPEQNSRLLIVAAVPLRQTATFNLHATCLTSYHHGYCSVDLPCRLSRLFPRAYPERVRTSPSVLDVAD